MVFYWIITLKTVVTHYVVGNPFVNGDYSILNEVGNGSGNEIQSTGKMTEGKGSVPPYRPCAER